MMQKILDAGIHTSVVRLMGHSAWLVAYYATMTVGNLLTGHDRQIDVIVKDGAVPALFAHATCSDFNLKDIAWLALSNIGASIWPHHVALVSTDEMIAAMERELETSNEGKAWIQALWCLANVCANPDVALRAIRLTPLLIDILSSGVLCDNNRGAICDLLSRLLKVQPQYA
jgi:hypothetical protein